MIPCLRYADAPAAIRFLTAAFGFTEHMVAKDDHGGILHAELVFGEGDARGMLMLGSESRPLADWKLPKAAGGVTGCIYVVVAEVDRHCETARKAGAEILEGPVDRPYGGRDYLARDPEGHLWSFGTYDPWEEG